MKFRNASSIFTTTMAVAAITFILAVRSQAQTLTPLYTFTGPSTGEFPVGGVISDSSGNLYGTTYAGGNSTNAGTVFMLSPTGAGVYRKKVLHYFGGANDGVNPNSGLLMDFSGNLYGVTVFGGNNDVICIRPGPGCGIVFELSPTPTGTWREKILHTFTGGGDGGAPNTSLIFDGAGNLYGTASYGGNLEACATKEGCGVAFRLSPTVSGPWKETVLRQFRGSDGAYPEGALVFDSSGNLYGTSWYGGSLKCPEGCGVAFELSPTSSGPWHETVIHSFTGGDGGFPNGSLIFDAAGNLYGTSYQYGTNALGNVFELSPSVGGTWTETTLYTFYGPNGALPQSPLIFDEWGNLYGVAQVRRNLSRLRRYLRTVARIQRMDRNDSSRLYLRCGWRCSDRRADFRHLWKSLWIRVQQPGK